jgi:hypothetical protein
MKTRIWTILFGLVIPYLAIVGAFPFYNRAEPFILGFPFIYFWVFSWIPLTSLSMYIGFRLDPLNKEEPSQPGISSQAKGD